MRLRHQRLGSRSGRRGGKRARKGSDRGTAAPMVCTLEQLEGRILLAGDIAVTVDSLLTKDNTPQLTGTVDDTEADIVVRVGGANYAATNNGDGTWTLGDGTVAELTDGTYDVLVLATDGLSFGIDETDDELVVDTEAPTVTVGELTTNDTTPELTGAVDDEDATVVVTVDGDDYAATNNGDGTWTLADGEITPALAEGTYDVGVTATDLAGNDGTDATDDELVVDTTAPTVTVDELTTNDTTPELTGAVNDEDATVVVNVDGEDYAATNNGDGTWTLADDEIDPALEDGTYDVAVTATDLAGNDGTDDSEDELVVDTEAPTVTVDELTTNDTTPELTGTVDDEDATVVVTVDGDDYAATNNGDGTWTLADDTIDPALAEGTYNVSVSATDAAGNEGADATADELVVTNPGDISLTPRGVKSVKFVDVDGTTVTISISGSTGQVDLVLLSTSDMTVGGTASRMVLQADDGIFISSMTIASNTAGISIITAGGGDGLVDLRDVTSNSLLDRLFAPTADLEGDGIAMAGLGVIGTLVLHDVNADVNMAGQAVNGSVLRANSLGDVDVTMGAVRNLQVKGGSQANLILDGGEGVALRNAAITGNVTGLWDITGDMGSVRIGGALDGAEIRLASNLKSLTVGSMVDSLVFAGVDEDVDELPTDLDQLAEGHSITKVVVGSNGGGEGDLFVNSNIAAWSVGTVSLTNIGTDNDLTSFGVVGQNVAKVMAVGTTVDTWLTTDWVNGVDLGDFVVDLLS